MEIDVILFSYFVVLYLRLNCKDSFEKQTFVVVFCIFDDASGKINSINSTVYVFESSKFESKNLFQNVDSKVNKLLKRKFFPISKQRVCHSSDSRHELLFFRSKRPRFNINRLPNELIVIFAHCE